MKILKIEIIRIAIPFSSGRKIQEKSGQDFNAASPLLDKMESLIVKVYSSGGEIGWGEAFGHLMNPVTFSALEHQIAPFFLNKTISNKENLQSLMQEAEYAFHGFGRTGPIRYALSAIDIALWDLLAQKRKLPLWKLLGGKRQKIALYPSLVSYENNAELVHHKVKDVVSKGFKQVKLHETAFDAIKAAKDALTADCQLMLDVNCIWNKQQAEIEISKLKTLNLKWLEEPVWPVDDFDALKQLNQLGVPLSAGENAAGEQDTLRLVEQHIVDIIQPSVAKIGGIGAVLDIIRAGEKHNVTVVPHCFYYGPAMLATAHLVTLLPKSVHLEVPYVQFLDHLHDLTRYKPEVMLPDLPGLGFKIDCDIIKKYTIASKTIISQGA